MSVTWATFRTQLRRSILKDVGENDDPDSYTYGHSVLLDAFTWALREFAAHTAVATSTSFTGDGTTTEFAMPSNLFSPLEREALVSLNNGSTVEYLRPLSRDLGATFTLVDDIYQFWEWPVGTLKFFTAPLSGVTINVDYFAHWDAPLADTDVISVPQWAFQPLMYLTASIAHLGASSGTASIRQWNQRPDTGTPEHNPLYQNARHFREFYEIALSKMTPQRRQRWQS